MSDNGSDIGAFMAGFVIGGLVGAATALILAPQSGEETRSQIAARGADIRVASEERIGEVRNRVQDSTTNIQEQARIVLDEGKTKVSSAVEKGKQRVEGLSTSIEEEVKG